MLPVTLATHTEGTATQRAHGHRDRSAAIAAAHRAAGFDSPRETAEVRAVRRGISAASWSPRNARPRRSSPPSCAARSPRCRRRFTVHAIVCCFCSMGGRVCRSALVALDVSDLVVDAEGLDHHDSSRQDRSGRPRTRPHNSLLVVGEASCVRCQLHLPIRDNYMSPSTAFPAHPAFLFAAQAIVAGEPGLSTDLFPPMTPTLSPSISLLTYAGFDLAGIVVDRSTHFGICRPTNNWRCPLVEFRSVGPTLDVTATDTNRTYEQARS